METKLGKNRTEAEVKRFTEEKERLEKEKDEIRAQLTQLRKERRELKEMLGGTTGRGAGQGGMCGNELRWGHGERGGNEPGPPGTRRDGGNLVLWAKLCNPDCTRARATSVLPLGQNTGKIYRTCPDPCSPQELPRFPAGAKIPLPSQTRAWSRG